MAVASRPPINRIRGSELVDAPFGAKCNGGVKESFVRFVSLVRESERRRSRRLGLGVSRVRRGRRVVVGASPPTEDAVVVTEPLTKEDLVGYLASGCKSKEKWR